MERFPRALSVSSGSTALAPSVSRPWMTPTGTAENMHPMPMDPESTITMMKSSIDLVISIDESP